MKSPIELIFEERERVRLEEERIQLVKRAPPKEVEEEKKLPVHIRKQLERERLLKEQQEQ
jgi:hypothetical protein